MANYLVTLLFPTTARTEARDVATAITGVDHSAAFPAGLDYTGGTSSKIPVHLSLNETQATYAKALRYRSLNCKMIIRSSNWKVLYSDYAEIALDATVRDAALQAALQTTFTETPDTPTASDNVTVFGREWYVKTTGDPLPGAITPLPNSVFIDTSGFGRDTATLCQRLSSGTYYGAEIKDLSGNGYGTYRFSTAGRVNNLGSNITYGAFVYASGADGGLDPFEEGGFEMGGIVNGDTCHMYHFRDDTLASNVALIFDPGNALIFHWEYTWTPDRLTWRIYSRDNVLLYQASSTVGVDDYVGGTWRFNAWSYLLAPSAESRLTYFDYSFTPA